MKSFSKELDLPVGIDDLSAVKNQNKNWQGFADETRPDEHISIRRVLDYLY